MMKGLRFYFFYFFAFIVTPVFATHNRAGEITYQWIGADSSDLKYRVTITTFTKTSSINADRDRLDTVYWGDGTPPVVFNRVSKTYLGNDISKNIYINEHTYVGNGVFKIHFTDPNRNANVVNIQNSVSVPFYLESTLVISPFLGQNNSPVLTYQPIDQGCLNRVFIHNPGAYDPDPGDSLSYELEICGGFNGEPIASYTFPTASNSFSLNSVTGDLTWDSPIDTGEYNVAFNIIQWRNGYNIGVVRRDMQILIRDCNNNPPDISVITDTCVLAGDTLSFDVTAIDQDQHHVILSASGGPLDNNLVSDPATFTPVISFNDTVVSRFSWATKCSHIRPQPYYVQFRAIDSTSGTTPQLVDLKGTFIRVLAPPPASVSAVPNGSSIDVFWSPPPCSGVSYYNVYRRNGLYPDSIHCPCDNGVPAFTGYTLIGRTADGTFTSFNDDNGGQGLTIGIQYCYLITAVYPSGSESCASVQTCTSLKKDAPVITNADVRITDAVNGSVFIAWSKPTELDTLAFPGPYEYRVYRSNGLFGSNFNPVPVGILNNLNDTTFIDSLIDTRSVPWSYKIELYYTDVVLKLKGQTGVASTVFLQIAPTDNALNLTWSENVPWTNQRYDIFKLNPSLPQFDSIASVTSKTFTDTGLVNGTQYCYFIRSSGTYFFSGFIDPILNRSQQVCETPIDNVHPCSPVPEVSSDCDNNLNQLVWTNPNTTCADDVLGYYIYYGSTADGNFERIDSVNSPFDTIYIHDNLARLSGCYKIAAYDSVYNETLNPDVVCIDTCRQYVLPSVFTPDGDGKNDLFHPCDSTTALDLQVKNCPPYRNVNSVDMKIYNRWGALVYETKDKNINWDGKYKGTKKECSEGVYYYVCKVFFFSVSGEQIKEIHGTVQLIR